ncbi:MAG: ribonuclease III [Clostridia bacterium]|nr:ribonuclease III [Clostridia bacterium]
MSEEDAGQVSAASLAYLGDSVLEILVRERLVITGARNPSVESLKYVTAPVQSEAFAKIEGILTEKETDMFKRGRNCVHSGNVPKKSTPAQYRRATGLETLFGYLYLSGQPQRIRQLFASAFPEIP